MNDIRRKDLSPLALSAARRFSKAGGFTYAYIKPDLTYDQVDRYFGRMIGNAGETIAGRP